MPIGRLSREIPTTNTRKQQLTRHRTLRYRADQMTRLASPRVLLAALAASTIGLVVASCDAPVTTLASWWISPDTVEREGTIELDVDGLDGQVTIWFDEHAVPHVHAPDEPALVFAMGYLHGRDRRFQLETFRLAAAGRLREIAGDRDQTGVLRNLETFGRAVGFARIGQEHLDRATPADRTLLESYAAGINQATVREPKPMEFRLLGYEPEPWTAIDTTMVMSMISFGLCKNWQLELGRLELITHQLRSGGSVERAMAIWKPRYRLPPHLIGVAPDQDPFADIQPLAPELRDHLVEWASASGAVEPGVGEAAAGRSTGGPVDAVGRGGSRSNNWAMDGTWTGTGKGALSSDPHMAHSLPPMGYLMHVRCDDSAEGPFEVIGAGFAGLPSLPFATNGKVAWGVTANWGDVTDLYVERLAPGRDDHYMFEGEALPFEVRDEVFRIRRGRNQFDTETRRIRSTRHGVVVNDFVDRLPPEFPIVTLRWSRGGGAVSALRGLYRAETVREAREALLDFDLLVAHFALADHLGDIAYAGTMRLPERRRHLGTLPVPGWTGTYEWQGTIAAERLPWLENPPAGYLGTANQQLVQPESTGYPLNFDGDVAHRYRRIMQVLGGGHGDRTPVEVTAALQQDGFDWGHGEVRALTAGPVRDLIDDPDEAVSAAARAYINWDGHCDPEAVGPSLDQSLNATLVKTLLEDEVRPATLDFVLNFYNIEPLVYDLLTDPSNPAWDDRRTDQREAPAAVISSAFRETVAAMRARHGEDVSTWTWSRVAPFKLMHPLGTQKLLGKVLNRGPLPTRGTSNTVFKHQFMRGELTTFPVKFGPVLRVNIDLADLTGSRMSIPGGQSGRPASPHYDDLLPLYTSGRGVSMQMGFDDIEARATGKLLLR